MTTENNYYKKMTTEERIDSLNIGQCVMCIDDYSVKRIVEIHEGIETENPDGTYVSRTASLVGYRYVRMFLELKTLDEMESFLEGMTEDVALNSIGTDLRNREADKVYNNKTCEEAILNYAYLCNEAGFEIGFDVEEVLSGKKQAIEVKVAEQKNKPTKKECNKMKNLKNGLIENLTGIMGTEYGIDNSDRFKACLSGGISVYANDGGYKAYNKETGEVINTRNLVMDTPNMFFKAPVSKIKEGDITIHNGEVMFVKKVNEDNSIIATNPENGKIETIAPIRDLFGFKTYTKVFSLLTLFGASDYGSILDKLKDGDNIIDKVKPMIMTLGGLYIMGGKEVMNFDTENIQSQIVPMITAVALGYGLTSLQDNIQGGTTDILNIKDNNRIKGVVDFAKSNPMLIGGALIGAYILLKDKIDISFLDDKLGGLGNTIKQFDKKTLILIAGSLVGLYVLGKKFNITSIEDIKKIVTNKISEFTNSDIVAIEDDGEIIDLDDTNEEVVEDENITEK